MYIPYDRNLGTSPTNQVDLQIVTSVGDIHNENFFKPNVGKRHESELHYLTSQYYMYILFFF